MAPVAIFPLRAAATQTTLVGFAQGIILPPGTFKAVFQNNSGFTLNATGSPAPPHAMAAIVVPISFGATSKVLVAGTAGGAAWDISINTNGTFTLVANNGGFVTYNSTLVLTLNSPYFIAISAVAGVGARLVAVNLHTGQVYSQVVASATGGPTATTTVASWGKGFLNNFNGVNVACTMFGSNALSMPQLLQWAQDPWSFWYPRRFDLASMLKGDAAAGGLNLDDWIIWGRRRGRR